MPGVITIEEIRCEKVVSRLLRKQRKEIDALTKRQLKERSEVVQRQATMIEKLILTHDRERNQSKNKKR